LVYAHDVNLLGKKINTVNRTTEALLDTSKEVCLKVNAEKTKYMFMSCHETAGQNHIKTADRSFENVTKQTFGNDKNNIISMKNGISHFGNACYHSVHNFSLSLYFFFFY
jgi:hypothetical protein